MNIRNAASAALAVATLTVVAATAAPAFPDDGPETGWRSLFDGETLEGWEATEHPEGFTVENGAIKAAGAPMGHLMYVGPVNDHIFKNFELKLEVMTRPGSNGGVFFHTEPNKGALRKGYEAQVNATHSDPKRTGSLFAIEDVFETEAKDDEWFEYHIIVKDKRIVLKVNGKTTVDYTEPPNPERPRGREGRLLSKGMIALQGHDPDSVIFYRNIRVKVLPD